VSKLKDTVKEFAEIAKGLPDNLQVVCFELLLRHHFDTTKGRPSKVVDRATDPAPEAGLLPPVQVTPPAEAGLKQEDLKPVDLHLKAKSSWKSTLFRSITLTTSFSKKMARSSHSTRISRRPECRRVRYV
jgi:hypothetical protein